MAPQVPFLSTLSLSGGVSSRFTSSPSPSPTSPVGPSTLAAEQPEPVQAGEHGLSPKTAVLIVFGVCIMFAVAYMFWTIGKTDSPDSSATSSASGAGAFRRPNGGLTQATTSGPAPSGSDHDNARRKSTDTLPEYTPRTAGAGDGDGASDGEELRMHALGGPSMLPPAALAAAHVHNNNGIYEEYSSPVLAQGEVVWGQRGGVDVERAIAVQQPPPYDAAVLGPWTASHAHRHAMAN